MNDETQTPTPLLATRSVEAILERRAHRIRRHTQVFAPDFVHGDATLDELYERFGDWAESAVFVRSIVQDGTCVAVSVARFEDWFLGVEHANRTNTPDIAAWLAERLADRGSVIELVAGDAPLTDDGEHWVTIACDATRLHELERSVLSVTRDVVATSEDWTQTAQTDLLSLVCLCARLGKDA